MLKGGLLVAVISRYVHWSSLTPICVCHALLVVMQSLQTELAVARQQKQVLLQQTVLPGLQLADHDAAALQLIATKAQPPLKAAASSAAATSVSPSKQAPLRSLSWGGKPKQSARPPLRRNTAEAKTLHTALPPQLLRQQEPLSPPDSADHDALQQTQHSQQRQIQQDEQHLLQIQAEQLPQQLVVPLQPLQQAIPQPKVEQWLLQHQEGPESAMSQAQHAALRQKVLQEVMQAITLQGSNISTPVNVQVGRHLFIDQVLHDTSADISTEALT